jgi:acylpyruvate hydrolase
MKIFCVGRNYAEHIRELQNAPTTEPLLFMKPPTALIMGGGDFPYPSFSSEVHHEVELVLKIDRHARNVGEAEADGLWSHIGIGLDFTARDLQDRLKKSGQPWEIAKSFDGSAPVAGWLERASLPNEAAIQFRLEKNGHTVQRGDSSELIFKFPRLLAHISRFFTLEPGDLVFTGTPAGVGPVVVGDTLVATLEDRLSLRVNVV